MPKTKNRKVVLYLKNCFFNKILVRKTDTSSDNVLESLKSKRLSAQFAATTSVCLSQGIFIAVVFGVAGLFAFAAVLLFNLLLRYELRYVNIINIEKKHLKIFFCI